MTADDDRPNPMQRLAPLVGAWTMRARFPQRATDAPARATFEWILGEQYLMQRTSIDIPEAPDAVSIVSANPDGETYTQHYFDSRGVTRLYLMTFAAGTWTLTRTTPDFSPLDFSQRFTGDLDTDGNTISGRWESSPDGSSWEHDFELDYVRVPPGA